MMEITWLVILGFMVTMYAILDGFDFGAGILTLFVSKSEDETEKIKKSIGPFWDGNEVWLIAAGGLLFMAFPVLYASLFSGFYLPLMLILWLIMGRGVSLELAHQINSQLWKTFWNKIFGFSSLLLALIFGIAFGNIVRGVNLGGVFNGRSLYEPHYFFSPLWTTLTQSENPGIIDWLSLLIGILVVFTLMVHGGNWVTLKISDPIINKIKKWNGWLTLITFVLTLISTVFILNVRPNFFDNYFSYPILFLVPVISLVALGMNGWFNRKNKELPAFLSSSVFIAGMISSTMLALFPTVLPSTNNIHPGLSIYSTANTEYGLQTGLTWWIFGIILISGYTFTVHWIYRGKIRD